MNAPEARNLGVERALGTVVAFLDDDDLWTPTFIEQMLAKILEANADVCIGTLDQLRDGSVHPWRTLRGWEDPRTWYRKNPGVTGSNLMVRRDYFLALGGFDAKLPTGEDKDFMIRSLTSGAVITVARSAHAINRRNHSSLTHSFRHIKGQVAFLKTYAPNMGAYDFFYNLYRIVRELLRVFLMRLHGAFTRSQDSQR